MRKHYDFFKAKKNPYAKKLKTSITIRLDLPRWWLSTILVENHRTQRDLN